MSQLQIIYCKNKLTLKLSKILKLIVIVVFKQVYCPVGRMPTCKETIYQERVNQLFADVEFSNAVFRLVPATISYFSSLSDLSDEINRTELMVPEESWKDLTRFAVLCMEVSIAA